MTNDINEVKVSELIKKTPNRFLLAIAAAKRARQLKEGAKPLVETDPENMIPLYTALEEFQEGKLDIILEAELKQESLLDDIDKYIEGDKDEEKKDKDAEEKDSNKKAKKETKSKKKSKSLAA